LRDIGFLEAVKKGQITFVVFHILGSSIASLNEIEETAPFTADAEYFLVKNFINNTNFFEWDQATHASYFKKLKDAVVIEIPKLNGMAYAGRTGLRSVPHLRRQQGRKERNRQLLVCAARLCAALARQCVGRIRSGEIARSVRGGRRNNAGAGPGRRQILGSLATSLAWFRVESFFTASGESDLEKFAISFYCRSSRIG
jgi:hypothetical protein